MLELAMAEENNRNAKLLRSKGGKGTRSAKAARETGAARSVKTGSDPGCAKTGRSGAGFLHLLGTLLLPVALALLVAGAIILFENGGAFFGSENSGGMPGSGNKWLQDIGSWLRGEGRSSGKSYDAQAFGISTAKSSVDYDHDGRDDYADFLLGAQKDAKNHPRYDGRYLESGWPPENIGVCADVVWRAFREAGYDLRAMVDKDIAARRSAYTSITRPDSNIDFRRVRNLKVFFEKYGQALTLDKTRIDQWQPGDIVIFGANKHVGIVSDKRNADGVCWIIHNGGQAQRDEDYLSRTTMEITGHYRFDASRVPADMLVQWKGEN